MTSDPAPARVELLTKRAARTGYRLIRGPGSPYDWTLLDAEDGEPLHSATTLDQIEQWLDE
jgi:hypothetical protein